MTRRCEEAHEPNNHLRRESPGPKSPTQHQMDHQNMSTYYYHPPPPGASAYPPYYQQPPPPGTLHLSYLSEPPPHLQILPLAAAHSPYDEVRTLFVAGLPDDVMPRELYNLFREFPGYHSSHLRSSTKSSSQFAFATFADQASALAAMHELNGMVFDMEKGSTLHIDLAKSNSRSKRSRTDDEWLGSDKKKRGAAVFSGAMPDSGFGSVHFPGMANSAYNTIGYAPSAPRAGREPSALPQKSSAAPPCPTLFAASLGPNCTEEELVQIFSRHPGFLKLKMQTTYGAPVAFVDFQDTASSTEALNRLQGTVLSSSLSGECMRLEYARSRMGKRRKPK